MTLGDIPQLMGLYLFLQIGAALFGFLASVGIAIRLVQGKETPGAVVALPLFLPALAVMAAAMIGLATTASVPDVGIATNVGSRLIGWLFLWPASAVLLIAGVISAFRAEEKSWGAAGAAGAAVLAVLALPWAYGWPEDDTYPVGARFAVYAVTGLLAVLAMAGATPGKGRDHSVAAAAAFAFLVAGGEMFQRGLTYTGMIRSVPSPESVPKYVEMANTAVVFKLSPWNHLTMVAALVPLLIAVGLAARDPSARVRTATALIVVLVAPLLYLTGDPTVEAWRALAAMPK